MRRTLCILLLVGLIALSVEARRNFIRIKGSDTEVNVVQALAESFMAKNKKVFISVTGGGSGVGIAGLINRKTDIANVSRLMSEEELKLAQKRGVQPVRFIFATDALAVIVNPKNPVTSLTMEELGRIFRGQIKSWKEVGGTDIPISLYGRQNNSGTFIFFRGLVLHSDYSPQMKRMNGNSQIVEAIRRDPAGIGYVGVGYVFRNGKVREGIKILSIKKDKHSPPVSPTDWEKVRTGKYPIVRPLNQYINLKAITPELIDFIKFELSPEGQKIVHSSGFYPILEDYKKINGETLGKITAGKVKK